VGAGNPYGHPAPSTVATLARAVPSVFRTDRDGDVTLTAPNSKIGLVAAGR
jgi:competence protein ComEC